ncbi:serine/threonine-protein kinase [Saccharothrix longispora]|uniref:serine/threonine-protein kinase n=1 Tax=Saccharothrix longispora TaxID=33920 RepID=UPI0028FD6F7C|nr:serine/threonine-protein kinase [Saccharothrix longispora]MBY8851299.1 serine/threonine protein kinase [Saccharothrix sp. MB29]MDU0294359.1 serine/threonine-protein kinase [Saccharothrix longispora]
MSEDLSGRRLGHYRIDGVLGRGGMSVTYRATDVRLGRKVALKVIGEHLTADAEFRERFVDEARNTSAIDHANIVPLYDFDEVDGLLYIAMRLVDGQDLAALIKDGPLSPARTLTLLGQVAEALDMLHGKGLVHLDVKPANVLVTAKEAVREHVYLADFGLTRRGATGHRTRTGDFLGSPTYAAPEHLRGEPLDGRTDQYALACMLFACLSGRPPYQGGVQEVIQGHLASETPSLTALVSLPPAIDDVLRKGTSKDPSQRYGSCAELINAARVALSAAPQGAPPPRRTDSGSMPALGAQGQAGGVQAGGVQAGGVPGQQGQPGQPGQPGQQPYRPPYQQQPPGFLQEPVRLRPPAQVGASAFTSTGKTRPAWFAPVVVGAVAIAAIVVLVFILTPKDEPPRPVDETGTTQSIDVGGTSDTKPLPTSVPVRTSR